MRVGFSGRGWAAAGIAAAFAAALLPAGAAADHPQPAPDINAMDYGYAGGQAPPGSYAFGSPIPQTTDAGKLNPNPSGKWLAYDTNVFESLTFPGRQPGDEKTDDAPGNGGMPYGFCPPNPQFVPSGRCDNHQLEYLDHFEAQMKQILGDFGVVVKRYQFDSPGSRGSGDPGTVGGLQAAPGRAFNISATIPGADHPDETILVSGHYDFTDGAPAAGWDSSEGHAEVMRIAKIMADYWRATGTRPSATVKFIPWDSEESGTFGSIDYVENNIPPGEEGKIRGYFNMDPCAGAYPAFYHGSPSQQVNEVLQLSDPAAEESDAAKARDQRFNDRAEKIVDEVFDHLDDKLYTQPGTPDIFVSDAEAKASGGSSDRSKIVTALGGLLAFSSDYANFDAIGVPVFNLFPDFFGPHADGTPASAEGVGILHSPRDNITTLNGLTSTDQSGMTASEGWAKGMEMCAQIEGWYMLQPEMGGAQTRNGDLVAYYEALPNEAIQRQRVTFDAGGSYQFADPQNRAYVDDSKLQYLWDFGDGQTGTGKVAQHSYPDVGRYQTKLTVRNTETGQTDTMQVPVEVIGSKFDPPVLKPPAAKDDDGTFPLEWDFAGTRAGFREYSVEESSNFTKLFEDAAEKDPAERWKTNVSGEAPATGDPVQPWQSSSSSTPKALGNKHHSGDSGYWTGASPTVQPAGVNRESVLTLAQPVALPKTGEVDLQYYSLFASEVDDVGKVDVAIDDGNPDTPLEWQTVDTVSQSFAPDEPGALTEDLEPRRVDLARFKGRSVLVRFRWVLGPQEGNRTQPAGWYVDDIRIASGDWAPIGTSATKTFTVFGKPKGVYAYRVKGVYNDDVETQPSNVESVEVTKGVAATRDSAQGVANELRRCRSNLGFAAVSAKPRRRGLSFRFSPRRSKPVTVSLVREAAGRRILANKTVVRFKNARRSISWRGRRGLASGYYVARFRMELGKEDALREVALRRIRGRFAALPPFHRPASCATLRSFKLGRPVFGGTRSRPLRINFRLARAATVALTVRRSGKIVHSYKAAERFGRVTYHLDLPAEFLRRGQYRVQLRIAGPARRKADAELFARRL